MADRCDLVRLGPVDIVSLQAVFFLKDPQAPLHDPEVRPNATCSVDHDAEADCDQASLEVPVYTPGSEDVRGATVQRVTPWARGPYGFASGGALPPDETGLSEGSHQEWSRQGGFENLFEVHHSRLFATLCLVTGDRAEAKDVAQQALMKLLERWERVEDYPPAEAP